MTGKPPRKVSVPVVVHTLDSVRERCTVKGNCWLWTGNVNSSGAPTTRHEQKTWIVRRLVLKLHRGDLPPDGRPVRLRCGNPRCVSPAHVMTSTYSAVVRQSWRSGERRPTALDPIAKLRMLESRKTTKLSLQQAREIRMDPRTRKEIAEAYGVSKSLIDGILTGHVWKEAAPNCSVFHLRA